MPFRKPIQEAPLKTTWGFQGYREAMLLLIVAALGVALRAFFATQVRIVSPDGAFYGMLARTFLHQGFFESLHVYWSPLYPTVVGVFALFIEDVEQAGRAVSVLCGGALVFPVYLLAKRFYGRSAAVVAVILVAVYPFLIERSTRVATESLYTLLLASLLVSGWLALERGQARHFGLTGIFLALLYLTRTEGCAFVLLFMVFGLLRAAWTWGRRTVVRVALGEIVLVFSFLAVSSPYLVFIHDQTGRWSPGLRGLNFVSSMEQLSTRREGFRISPDGRYSLANQVFAGGKVKGYALWQSRARIDVKWVLGRASARLYKVYQHYQPTLVPGVVLVFVSLGLFAMTWDRQRLGREGYLITLVVCTTFGYALAHVKERYFLCLLPIFLMWAAHGVLFASGWVRDTLGQTFGLNLRRTSWITAGVIAVLILSYTPKYVKYAALGNTPPRAEAHLRAGWWVKANMAKGLTIMSRKPYVAFYAEGRHLYIPEGDLSQILEYASQQGVDLLVVDQEWTPSHRPQLKGLLDERDAPKSLALVYKTAVTNREILVYQLVNLPRELGPIPTFVSPGAK